MNSLQKSRIVILSAAKDLNLLKQKILRYAQNDGFVKLQTFAEASHVIPRICLQILGESTKIHGLPYNFLRKFGQ